MEKTWTLQREEAAVPTIMTIRKILVEVPSRQGYLFYFHHGYMICDWGLKSSEDQPPQEDALPRNTQDMLIDAAQGLLMKSNMPAI